VDVDSAVSYYQSIINGMESEGDTEEGNVEVRQGA